MDQILRLIRTAVVVVVATGPTVTVRLLAQDLPKNEPPAQDLSAQSEEELRRRALQWELRWDELKRLLQAERRGILLEQTRPLLAEARRRGLLDPIIRQAAEQGDAEAQLSLGFTYDKGRSVENHAEAARWFRLAAEQGLDAAQYQLGLMYLGGRGVLKDHARAVRWLRLAAGQNYGPAQHVLGGVMYIYGLGVLKDSMLAHMWLNIASANGEETAGKDRDDLERNMTRAEIGRATELARECMASDYQDCEP